MKNFINKYKNFIIFCILFLIISFVKYKITGSGIPCVFSEITGLSCPGCGISRMLLALVKLDVYQAFRYNPLVFILLIATIVVTPIILVINKKFNKKIQIPVFIYYIIIVLLIGYGIMRNIPAFSYLLPTVVN